MATKTTAKTTPKTAVKTTPKATPKAEPVKVDAVVPSTPKAAPVKAGTTPKKTVAKKPAAKKPAVKKEIKVKTVVEHLGRQVEEKEVIANVKKAWSKSGKKIGDIKTMEIYIKPEEETVYYVINETDTGSVAF